MAKIIKIVSKHGNFDLIVDDEDFDRVNEHRWWINKQRGKFRAHGRIDKTQKLIKVHRFILNVYNPKIMIDHINMNPLDNRKENLRIVTNQQNSVNKKLNKNNKSGYKGVFYSERDKKWVSKVKYNYKNINLGRFKTKEEAAHAYNAKVFELFGDFAYLNTIKQEK